MNTNNKLLMAVGAMLSCSVMAGTMGPIQTPRSWSPMISISAGPSWSNNGQSQTFYLQPDIQKTYAAIKTSQTLASGELFLGMQHAINSLFLGQLGIAFAGSTQAKQIGDIWEDADPDFNNFSYKYKINHQHIAVKGKLLADLGKLVMPYLSASAGVGSNRANEFTITPKLFEEIPAPSFQGNSTTAFTYTLGIGVQKAISTHWQVGVGYEFADWGRSQLERAPGQTLNSGLNLSNLYTNSILFSLSYVA